MNELETIDNLLNLPLLSSYINDFVCEIEDLRRYLEGLHSAYRLSVSISEYKTYSNFSNVNNSNFFVLVTAGDTVANEMLRGYTRLTDPLPLVSILSINGLIHIYQ